MNASIEGDSSDQDDISEIRQQQIWTKWKEKARPLQIARDSGESIYTVYRTLAIMQKALTEKIGVESYGRRKT